ncbi:MAG: 2-phospho-L-lactate guanylyltransferase CofC [Marmoricola sp.]|nr:2-phospho-L-lactate guanylyltransferase CofC [Marmoricola sp.]
MTTRRYALLIPVKDGRSAKTRLGVGEDGQRARLMAAFARDAISAARATDHVAVHVVGDPTTLAGLVSDLDVGVLPDEGEGDLNRALQRAAARLGEVGLGTAVMLADLPCLRTADLDAAFASATGRAFVADADGTGTTLLITPVGTQLDPRFGAGSAAAHVASGAVRIGSDLASLRRDVDTTTDLEAALVFGVGRHTARVASSLA